MGEREERVTYTEDEIRKAWKILEMSGFGASYIEVLLQALEMNRKDNHIHDFTDDDTITVKEIREAWTRMGNPATWTSQRTDVFLKDISEHREPVYPQGSIWRDRVGLIYCRDGRNWLRFGTQVPFADNVPHRPLKRMEIQE